MSSKSRSSVKLKIEVKDKDGKVVQVIHKKGDIFLDQWGAIVAAVLKQLVSNSNTTTFNCKDTGGGSRTLGGATAGTSAVPYSPFVVTGVTGSAYVQLGTGSGTATHTDYALITAITPTGAPSVVTVSITGTNIINLTFTVSISPTTTPVTVTEAGFFVQVYDSGNTLRTLMLTHDTGLSASVPTTGSITLTYTLQYNTS